MYFPRYWAKATWQGNGRDGEPVETVAWGWSDISVEQARNKGRDRAQAAAMANWSDSSRAPASYSYSDRPLREPVLRILATDSPDGLEAVVTRNGIGCEILNTNRVVFIDVDLLPKDDRGGKPGFLSSLFGKKPEASAGRSPQEEEKIQRLQHWQSRHSDHRFRVYRTAAGLRYILTSHLYDPNAPEVRELFEACGTDPKYQKLCELQKSFRARLTPKHWRCNSEPPPFQFPFESPEQQKAADSWQSKYLKAAAGYATCKLLTHFGDAPERDDILRVLEEHDRLAAVRSELPLA